jgi:hypothetical protein
MRKSPPSSLKSLGTCDLVPRARAQKRAILERQST